MRLLITGFLLSGILIPFSASAAPATITLRHKHFLFTVPRATIASWSGNQAQWMYNGKPVVLPKELMNGSGVTLPSGFEKRTSNDWNRTKITEDLKRIAADLERSAGTVTIRKGSGGIVFDGVGFTGRTVDWEKATDLALIALNRNIADVTLPVMETAPVVHVTDPELQSQGIKELVTIGESNFAGSPANRRHNITTGLSKFNGHMIPQGSTFSFGEVLGPVNGATGYKRELVIKGDRTEPDYGGGLCQVSTTAYRGVWEYGFPIAQRKNHSYAVSYYGPQGTDATVYPPNPDMKFVNDSPGALLMQTYQENDKAYFLYYGTKDDRMSEVIGPFVHGTSAPPPDKTIYTTELKPGERRKVGDRHAGMSVSWFRVIKPANGTGSTLHERYFSSYEARPLFYEIGVESLPQETIIDDGSIITEDELNAPEPPRVF